MDAHAFALLVRWRPWHSLIGSATESIVELELQTLRHIGATQSDVAVPQLRSGAGLRMRHGFLVYSGGREIRSGDGTN